MSNPGPEVGDISNDPLDFWSGILTILKSRRGGTCEHESLQINRTWFSIITGPEAFEVRFSTIDESFEKSVFVHFRYEYGSGTQTYNAVISSKDQEGKITTEDPIRLNNIPKLRQSFENLFENLVKLIDPLLNAESKQEEEAIQEDPDGIAQQIRELFLSTQPSL